MDREVIVPSGIPKPLMPYTPLVRAGPWLFAAGQVASDFKNGIAHEASVPKGNPFSDGAMRRQTEYIFKNFEKMLNAEGTSLDNLVRIDQFWKPVGLRAGSQEFSCGEYLDERDRWLKQPRPASTGINIQDLLVKDALIEIDWIALIPDKETKKMGVSTNKIPNPTGGYAQAIKAGPYVFVAGMVPTDFKNGLAPKAQRNKSFWYGVDIKLQTAHILDELSIVLNESGSSLENVVDAHVYLTDFRDIYGMDEVWRKYFPRNPPARTILPFSYFPAGMPDGLIEIAATAVCPGGKVKREVVRTDAAPVPVLHESQAVKAGGLIWISGQMAADESGLASEACILGKLDPNFPFYTTSARRQVDVIIKNTKAICEAAGTSLKNIVKRQCFHTDFKNDFTGAIDAYFSNWPAGEGPASTTIEVKAPLAVPDCSIMIDQIGCVPSK